MLLWFLLVWTSTTGARSSPTLARLSSKKKTHNLVIHTTVHLSVSSLSEENRGIILIYNRKIIVCHGIPDFVLLVLY